jgi:hypothetical protein
MVKFTEMGSKGGDLAPLEFRCYQCDNIKSGAPRRGLDHKGCYHVLELKTLWCRKQTHNRQKILTREFLLIKRMQAIFTPAEQTHEHKMAASGFSIYP